MNNWNALRAHYAGITPLILAAPKNEWAVGAYDWTQGGLMQMTPIERWVWDEIRDANAVFYPQYPVGRFFVDFANPKAKVAIECDGAAYHLDKAKDAGRDAILERLGWVVYRAPGWLCAQDWNPETCEVGGAGEFVRRIAREHGLIREGSDSWEQLVAPIDHKKGGDL
ncbi:DUF559 domain-containing protein [Variovorax paradoxus]|nr:DUF559 domain-containing protein [Variovorax paradoxus]MBT2299244.1 DUF559 domain-containing protein [Variovorax paradoxus]